MKVLIDTQAFLWTLDGDERLSEPARETFLNLGNQLFLSAASLWEIGIKISLGRLLLRKGWMDTVLREMSANDIAWLPIDMPHCREVAGLPFHHRDPFDRMLIAQARVERMHLLSNDVQLSSYGIKRIW